MAEQEVIIKDADKVIDAIYERLEKDSPDFDQSILKNGGSKADKELFKAIIPLDSVISLEAIEEIAIAMKREMSLPPFDHPLDFQDTDKNYLGGRRAEALLYKMLHSRLQSASPLPENGEGTFTTKPLDESYKKELYSAFTDLLKATHPNGSELTEADVLEVFAALGREDCAARYDKFKSNLEQKQKNGVVENTNAPATETTEKPSNRNALIALFAGAATMIGGLLNLKKKKSTEPTQDGEEPPKAGFSTGGIIATALGAAATGWGIYMLVTAGKSKQTQRTV